MRFSSILAIALLSSLNMWCSQDATAFQDKPKSLADIAKESKNSNQQSSAKIVYTNDNLPGHEQDQEPTVANSTSRGSNALPQSSYVAGIPPLFPNDEYNVPDVLKAIENIKSSRGSAAAEASLHAWYNRYDEEVEAGYRKHAATPEKDQNLNDAVDFIKAARLEIALAVVRLGILKFNLNPDWFKLRCHDGNFVPENSGCPST